MINRFLAAALAYASRYGWLVFPLTPGSKRPIKDSHGYLDATTDPNQIWQWWHTWPRANVGIATGAASGLIVLDIDPRNAGLTSLHLLQEQFGLLPATRMVRTPGGGVHLYYRHPGAGMIVPCDNSGKLGVGIDVKADGGYVCAPPSVLRTKPDGDGPWAYLWREGGEQA